MRYRWIVAATCCIVWAVGMTIVHHQVHASQSAAAGSAAESEGTALFNQNCAVCHGADGRGGERAPDIASRPDIVALSDAQLTGIITKGIMSAGMPSFGHLGSGKIQLLVAHLRVLQGISNTVNSPLPGNAQAGKAIFFANGSCSSCHTVDGSGGFLGNDLSKYARGRTAAAIEAAIAHPDNSNSSWHLMTIRTSAGAIYRGLIRTQDNFTVILQSKDGSFHAIPRRSILGITDSGRSIMPQNYSEKLTGSQMNDLVSYLMKSARSIKLISDQPYSRTVR